MDKETLLKRKEMFTRQRDQFVANAQMCEGVIQDCQYWLAEIAKAEEKAQKKSDEDALKDSTNG